MSRSWTLRLLCAAAAPPSQPLARTTNPTRTCSTGYHQRPFVPLPTLHPHCARRKCCSPSQGRGSPTSPFAPYCATARRSHSLISLSVCLFLSVFRSLPVFFSLPLSPFSLPLSPSPSPSPSLSLSLSLSVAPRVSLFFLSHTHSCPPPPPPILFPLCSGLLATQVQAKRDKAEAQDDVAAAYKAMDEFAAKVRLGGRAFFQPPAHRRLPSVIAGAAVVRLSCVVGGVGGFLLPHARPPACLRIIFCVGSLTCDGIAPLCAGV